MKHFVSIFALLSLLCSCTKEIDIDYKDITPVPVIEGLLSPEKAEVKITMTRNMNDSAKTPGMEAQWVRILLPDGTATPLSFQSDGYYRSDAPIALNVGDTYTLQVSLDDVVYTGSSTMQPTIEITEPQFLWANIMDWMQILEFESVNVPDGVKAYGWVRIHRNGKIYFSDAGKTTGNSPFDIGLYYDSEVENDDEMILYSGDTLLLDVRTIDERVYTYLTEYNSTHHNPDQFFTPSIPSKICLGYFAVYGHVQKELIYIKTPHE